MERHMRAHLLFAICLLAGCATLEGASAPATTAAAPAVSAPYDVAVDLPGGTYRLDPRHASVLFRIRHEGLAYFTARFDTKDATLELDPADPSRSHLDAAVDANSVSTGLVNARGERSFDQSIARALGGAQIRFVSTAIERTGAHTAHVNGDLTLNGQTHPAALDVTFAGGAIDPLRGGAQVIGFSAQGEIDRTQWGVDEWRAFTDARVQIVIEAELVRS